MGDILDNHEKKCPKCAEYVKVEARVCRHCGNNFSEKEVERKVNEARRQSQERRKEIQSRVLWGIGVASVLLLLSGGYWVLSTYLLTPSASNVGMGGANPQRTGQYAVTGPTSRAKQKWIFESEVDVLSSPSVGDSAIYLGGSDGYLYAIDAASGELRWRFNSSHNLDESWSLLSVPTVKGETVYAGGVKSLHAVNATTGEEVWHFESAENWGSFTSPVVMNGIVYAGHEEGYLYAIDAMTGEKKWSRKLGRGVGNPAVSEEKVYLGIYAENQHLSALGVHSGEQKWAFNVKVGSSTQPAVSEGFLFVTGYDDNLYALDANSGEKRWSIEFSRRLTSPVVHGKTVCVGSQSSLGDHGYLYGIDAETGHEKWRLRVNSGVSGQPAVGKENIYAGGGEGQFFAVDAESGRKKWHYNVVENAGGLIGFSPALSNDAAYLSIEGKLYMFN